MYGHQFYQYSIQSRAEYLNDMLQSGRYGSLEALAAEIFIDSEDMKEELRKGGYYYVPDLNRFVQIEVGRAG